MANDSNSAKASGQGEAQTQKPEEAAGADSKTGMTLVLTAPAWQDGITFTEDDEPVTITREGTHVKTKAKAEDYIKRAAEAGITLTEKEG